MRKKKTTNLPNISKGTKCIGQMDYSRYMVIPTDTPDYILQQIGSEWAARRSAEYTHASVMAIEEELRSDDE